MVFRHGHLQEPQDRQSWTRQNLSTDRYTAKRYQGRVLSPNQIAKPRDVSSDPVRRCENADLGSVESISLAAQRIDPGFESKNLLVMGFDLGALHYDEGRGQQFFRAVIERAKTSPGVEGATVASNFPLGGGFSRTIFPEGQDETSGYRGTLTQLDDIAPNYFETLRIPLLSGREFTDGDRANTKKVVVASEAMAKHFWPNENAVGKRFHFFGAIAMRRGIGQVLDAIAV